MRLLQSASLWWYLATVAAATPAVRLVLSTSVTAPVPAAAQAVAELIPTSQSLSNGNAIRGTVTFTQLLADSALVSVRVRATGLTPFSTHGIHVHQWGDVSDLRTGQRAGEHFSVRGNPHGCPTAGEWALGAGGVHEGDIGNVVADERGGVDVEFVSGTVGVTLLPTVGQAAAVGRSVILHEKADDCVTQPDGAAGARYAQGVIGWDTEPSSTAMTTMGTNNATSMAGARAGVVTFWATPSGRAEDARGVVFLDQTSATGPVQLRMALWNVAAGARLALRVHATKTMGPAGEPGPMFGPFARALCRGGNAVPPMMTVGSDRDVSDVQDMDSAGLSLYAGVEGYAIGRVVGLYDMGPAGPVTTDRCGESATAGTLVATGVVGIRNPGLSRLFDPNLESAEGEEGTA